MHDDLLRTKDEWMKTELQDAAVMNEVAVGDDWARIDRQGFSYDELHYSCDV